MLPPRFPESYSSLFLFPGFGASAQPALSSSFSFFSSFVCFTSLFPDLFSFLSGVFHFHFISAGFLCRPLFRRSKCPSFVFPFPSDAIFPVSSLDPHRQFFPRLFFFSQRCLLVFSIYPPPQGLHFAIGSFLCSFFFCSLFFFFFFLSRCTAPPPDTVLDPHFYVSTRFVSLLLWPSFPLQFPPCPVVILSPPSPPDTPFLPLLSMCFFFSRFSFFFGKKLFYTRAAGRMHPQPFHTLLLLSIIGCWMDPFLSTFSLPLYFPLFPCIVNSTHSIF